MKGDPLSPPVVVQWRQRAIAKARARLQRDGFPRTLMGVLVVLTGLFGLMSSFVLMQWGLESMAVRYPIAMLLAYLFFLALIWAWLRKEDISQGDVPLPDGHARTASAPEVTSGGGGDFGGAGASTGWDAAAPVGEEAEALSAPLRHAGDMIGAAADGEELAIPFVLLTVLGLLLAGLLFASVYVVWIAPTLLAEVMVDGALAYALLRHLRGEDPQHWLATAVRRSLLPFVLTAVVVACVGAALEWLAPGSHSLGQAIQSLRASR